MFQPLSRLFPNFGGLPGGPFFHKPASPGGNEGVQIVSPQVFFPSTSSDGGFRSNARRFGLAHGEGPTLGPSLRQSLELRQTLELTLSLPAIFSEWDSIYGSAEKRVYDKQGLQFEYAVVRRMEFPYMLAIGTAGLCANGRLFVMEDFFLDLPEGERSRIVELIAVHEYGERLFEDHHQASLLEFAIAQEEGFLGRYLEILQEKYFLKIRDISLHRMGEELREAIEGLGAKVQDIEKEEGVGEKEVEGEGSARRASELRESFRWPADLRERFGEEALPADYEGLARSKIRDWASYIVASEQAIAYLNRAGEGAVRSGLAARESGGDTEEILFQMEVAFYEVLEGLAREIEEDVFEEKHFVGDLVGRALQEVCESIKARVQLDHPLFHRGFSNHLRIAKNEWEILTEAREEGPDTDEHPDEVSLREERIALWREVKARVASGEFKDEEAALHFLAEVTRSTKGVRRSCRSDLLNGLIQQWEHDEWKHQRRFVSLESYLFYMEKQALYHLAEIASRERDNFARIPDQWIQVIVDRRILRLWKAVWEGFSPDDREGTVASEPPVKIDVASARREFGRDLSLYLKPENDPELLYRRHLTALYESLGAAAGVKAKIYRFFLDGELQGFVWKAANVRGYLNEIYRKVEGGEIPEEMVVSLLSDYWHWHDPPFRSEDVTTLAYLMLRYGLSWDQAVLFSRYDLINRLRSSRVAWKALERFLDEKLREEREDLPHYLRVARTILREGRGETGVEIPDDPLAIDPRPFIREVLEGDRLRIKGKIEEDILEFRERFESYPGEREILDRLGRHFVDVSQLYHSLLPRVLKRVRLLEFRQTFRGKRDRARYFGAIRDLLVVLSAWDVAELSSLGWLFPLSEYDGGQVATNYRFGRPVVAALDDLRRSVLQDKLSPREEASWVGPTYVEPSFLHGIQHLLWIEKKLLSTLDQIVETFEYLVWTSSTGRSRGPYPFDRIVRRPVTVGPDRKICEAFLTCGVPRLEEQARKTLRIRI